MMTLAPTHGRLALDGIFWRRLAAAGAGHGPPWFVRWAPPVIGVAIAMAMPDARRRIADQLERARGHVGKIRAAFDVAATFANFASTLTEVLSAGSKNWRTPAATVHLRNGHDDVVASEGAAILVTAHTAGWESIAALLANKRRAPVFVVMQRERDALARDLNDSIRRTQGGLRIVHAGEDPLASLPLLRHLRDGGVVALQIDRIPAGMSVRPVTLFGKASAIPEGPLRLARLTGAPIVPVFSQRTGYRRYAIHVYGPVRVARHADDDAIDAAAQQLADALSSFVSAHPTQWFAFAG